MPRITLIPNLFAPRKRETIADNIPIGDKAIDHIPSKYLSWNVLPVFRGKRHSKKWLKRFHFTRPEDEIVLRVVPGDPVDIVIWLAQTIVSIAISLAIGAIATAIFKKKENKKRYDNDEESPTYGWDGIQNTTRNGEPIALVYGEHKVGGQFLSTYTDALADESSVKTVTQN